MPHDKPHMDSIESLLVLMAALRDPETGCPWDQQQDFSSIAPYTLEEAYEVVDAIESGDADALRDELGDLLFQVVFHAQMASEAGWFGFPEVVRAIVDKMTRRHPHVFGDDTVADAEEQTRAWERHKRREQGQDRRVLDGVTTGLPALARAEKLQRKAAHVGFDWPDVSGVLAKVEEELAEVRHELEGDIDRKALQDECGDLLFAVVNLLRHAGVDAEMALRQANRKFVRRFEHVETRCRQSGRPVAETSLDRLEQYWEQAKALEQPSDGSSGD